jgi:hypothetical protein
MDFMPMARFSEAIPPTSAKDPSAAGANGTATSDDSAKKTTESLIWVHLPYNNPHYVAVRDCIPLLYCRMLIILGRFALH